MVRIRRVGRLLVLASIVGAITGLGAAAFLVGLAWSTRLFLGMIVGYAPPAPVGEGMTALLPASQPWLLPVATALGALLSGLLTSRLAPEASGAGQDAAIGAIQHHGARVRARVAPVKLLASAVTIGSGGSGGREGPIAQISASLASALSDLLRVTPEERRMLVVAGMGAGIGALFRAPLGGAILAVEILHRRDIEANLLVPALVASSTSFAVFGSLFGFAPIFGVHAHLQVVGPAEFAGYAVLGIVCGLGGIAYSRALQVSVRLFWSLEVPFAVRAAIGGLAVGTLGLLFPEVLHTGFGWLQLAMEGDLGALPLWFLMLLPVAKTLATCFTVGSGGSGGVFGPATTVGGFIGVALWQACVGWLPGLPDTPAPFVLVGMMALFGSIAHVPLAMVVLVIEMTGSLGLVPPAILAVALATVVVGNATLFPSQLPSLRPPPAEQ